MKKLLFLVVILVLLVIALTSFNDNVGAFKPIDIFLNQSTKAGTQEPSIPVHTQEPALTEPNAELGANNAFTHTQSSESNTNSFPTHTPLSESSTTVSTPTLSAESSTNITPVPTHSPESGNNTNSTNPSPSVPVTSLTQSPGKPENTGLDDKIALIPMEYQELDFFKPEFTERYIEYKKAHPDYGYEKVITYVNIGLDKPFLSDIIIIKEPHATDVLVNKYNKLPDDFEPKLTEIPSSMCAPGMGKQYLRNDAKEAFEKMHNDAKELGLNITAYGTYRSIALQHNIWNNQVKSGRTIEDVDSLHSRGGHSEHHTGLTVDVIKNNYTVEDSKEYLWYKDNAHKYGFIIRYPLGKEHITGYSYEPWHLRFLGVELATEVYNSGLTYEEYYVMMIN
ncbi:MAG: D-alanyl-D-alanine carboxypeptidase family protein [Ruminiclostridium sp.]|nr:D-alanyl-D-alanine carboxypeptidase family protein [Ruminiclostridium sp.]